MSMLAIAALSTAAALAQAVSFQPPLNLDRPGVMESVERENPELHAKILQIRYLAARAPCFSEKFKLTLIAKFDARDAACGMLLQTSYPSKRTLRFTLGETKYVTVVEMDESANRLVPAK
jgi:hypothetical protein